MGRLLKIYLIVTGIGAAISLAAPWLVILGLFLLIVPGLLLAVMPTAFLCGCIFTAVWAPLHRGLGARLASLAAVALGGLLLWELPASSAAVSRERLASAVQPDVTPASRIHLAGHLRIDRTNTPVEAADPAEPGGARAARCDGLCVAALFTQGVDSVTLNPLGSEPLSEAEATGTAPLSPQARTFRRAPHGKCSKVLGPVDASEFGLDFRAQRALQAAWNVRLSTTECIEVTQTRTEHDLTIAQSRYRLFGARDTGRQDWSLEPRDVGVERLEMRARGKPVLLRRLIATTAALRQPLLIEPSGDMQSFHFGWSRRAMSNAPRYAQLQAGKQLTAYTDLAVRAAPAATARLVRTRLRAMLSDRSVGPEDTGWAAAQSYLTGLRDDVEPGDGALVAALIRDRRMTRFDGLWEAIAALGDDAAALRLPMVQRIASAGDAPVEGGPEAEVVRVLGKALDSLPAGALVAPSPAERALLADPAARSRAPGLIMRQADRGAAAIPGLMSILNEHVRAQAAAEAPSAVRRSSLGDPPDPVVIDAVRVALCRLGPAASSALPQLAAIDSSGLLRRRFDQDPDWQLTLARLGRPVETFDKPQNLSNSTAQWRIILRKRLAGIDLRRDCRSKYA